MRTPEAIDAQLQQGIALARKQGSAVLIGHPYPQTLAVLESQIPRLKQLGIELVTLPQMIATRGNQAMPAHGKHGRYSNR
ncbi:Divergent polysaccharide deacetylase [compost metagenome]